MTEPMEVLYTYAQEHTVHALLAQESGYTDAKLHAEKQVVKLRNLLPHSMIEEYLDKLLDEQTMCEFYRERALFRAGFSLAVELMQTL